MSSTFEPGVVGDTKILTDVGYIPIKDLVDKVVKVWNGNKFIPLTPFRNTNESVVTTVRTTLGYEIRCDNTFRMPVILSIRESSKRAEKLIPGDRLIFISYPTIENADSTKTISITPGTVNIFFVPDATYSARDRVRWLIQVLLAYAKISAHEIVITHDYKPFLSNLQLMMHSLGVNSTYVEVDNGYQKTHQLVINRSDSLKLAGNDHFKELTEGNEFFALIDINNREIKKQNIIHRVNSVVPNDYSTYTYSFKESKVSIIANGIFIRDV